MTCAPHIRAATGSTPWACPSLPASLSPRACRRAVCPLVRSLASRKGARGRPAPARQDSSCAFARLEPLLGLPPPKPRAPALSTVTSRPPNTKAMRTSFKAMRTSFRSPLYRCPARCLQTPQALQAGSRLSRRPSGLLSRPAPHLWHPLRCSAANPAGVDGAPRPQEDPDLRRFRPSAHEAELVEQAFSPSKLATPALG
jgi:hypothetical protein